MRELDHVQELEGLHRRLQEHLARREEHARLAGMILNPFDREIRLAKKLEGQVQRMKNSRARRRRAPQPRP